MPKIKTRRATAKRVKIVGKGRMKCGKAYVRHLLVSKTTKRKRHLRQPGVVPETLERAVRKMLPYG